nr:hypothetical protein HmN_000989100 [Hymenolepis microstoma]
MKVKGDLHPLFFILLAILESVGAFSIEELSQSSTVSRLAVSIKARAHEVKDDKPSSITGGLVPKVDKLDTGTVSHFPYNFSRTVKLEAELSEQVLTEISVFTRLGRGVGIAPSVQLSVASSTSTGKNVKLTRRASGVSHTYLYFRSKIRNHLVYMCGRV